MGVFDDAIREHLELKRQLGTDEAELKELEDEAFGQAARPGDPDFPGSTSEEPAVEAEAGESAPDAEDAASLDAGVASAEEATSNAPFDMAAETPAAEQPALAQPEEAPSGEPVSEVAPAATEPDSEEAAIPDASEPGEPAAGVEPESSFSTAEREAIADQPTVFFDQAPGELELGDLELDMDEEIEEVGGAVSEPLTDEEPPVVEEAFAEEPEAEVAEPPHEVEPEPEPPEEPPPLEPAPSDPEPEVADADAEPVEPVTDDFVPAEDEAEPGTGEDDVLEETPEFLRDNPDDDELWFEQGEPKDFDF